MKKLIITLVMLMCIPTFAFSANILTISDQLIENWDDRGITHEHVNKGDIVKIVRDNTPIPHYYEVIKVPGISKEDLEKLLQEIPKNTNQLEAPHYLFNVANIEEKDKKLLTVSPPTVPLSLKRNIVLRGITRN